MKKKWGEAQTERKDLRPGSRRGALDQDQEEEFLIHIETRIKERSFLVRIKKRSFLDHEK